MFLSNQRAKCLVRPGTSDYTAELDADSSQNDPESSECVETDLGRAIKTVDYTELTYMVDQCLAWLYTKMSCFYTVSDPLCVMLLTCHVSKYLSKIPSGVVSLTFEAQSLVLPSEIV